MSYTVSKLVHFLRQGVDAVLLDLVNVKTSNVNVGDTGFHISQCPAALMMLNELFHNNWSHRRQSVVEYVWLQTLQVGRLCHGVSREVIIETSKQEVSSTDQQTVIDT